MIVVGLTGSIGMGKSHVARLFRKLHVPVFDADEAVHELQRVDGALVSAIEARFPGTTGHAGVDRQKLGAEVLKNPQALAALESIIHPAVAAKRAAFLRRHLAKKMVVLDIPLLFEKGGWRDVDLIVVVSAPAWMQRRRVLRRAGMTSAKLAQIKRLQLPDSIKRQRADVVVYTGGLFGDTAHTVRHLVACIKAKSGGYFSDHA